MQDLFENWVHFEVFEFMKPLVNVNGQSILNKYMGITELHKNTHIEELIYMSWNFQTSIEICQQLTYKPHLAPHNLSLKLKALVHEDENLSKFIIFLNVLITNELTSAAIAMTNKL